MLTEQEEPRGYEFRLRESHGGVWTRLLRLGREQTMPGEVAARLHDRLRRLDPSYNRPKSELVPLVRTGHGDANDRVRCPGCGDPMAFTPTIVRGDELVGEPSWVCDDCELVIDSDAGLVRYSV